jgi:hypothetical protein
VLFNHIDLPWSDRGPEAFAVPVNEAGIGNELMTIESSEPDRYDGLV